MYVCMYTLSIENAHGGSRFDCFAATAACGNTRFGVRQQSNNVPAPPGPIRRKGASKRGANKAVKHCARATRLVYAALTYAQAAKDI